MIKNFLEILNFVQRGPQKTDTPKSIFRHKSVIISRNKLYYGSLEAYFYCAQYGKKKIKKKTNVLIFLGGFRFLGPKTPKIKNFKIFFLQKIDN